MVMVKTLFKTETPRDKKYLTWIDSKPCTVPGCKKKSTHHHVQEIGHGAKGQKCSDYRSIPLCLLHHNQIHSMGRCVFAKEYGVDYAHVIERLNKEWRG